MEPERKGVDITSSLGRCIFWAHSFQIGLATCIFFNGMVTCFQIKHGYMKQIVVHTFDQQQRATDSSAWYSGYGLRLVGVGVLSLPLCLNVVRLLSVRFVSWSKNVNAVTEKLNFKTKLGDIYLYKFKNTFSHKFLGWLNCTLGKHNQVRLHWNRGYDNAPEAKDKAFVFFICCNFLTLGLRIR